MDLLAYWRWDNYVSDLDEGAGFHFNSNQARLHLQIEVGETLWLVTGHPVAGGRQYPLVAQLTVAAKTLNPPTYKYGRYRLWGDPQRSRYFVADGPDATGLLRRFTFSPATPLTAAAIGQALQTLRGLTTSDAQTLTAWAASLTIEPRAWRVAEERRLEAAYSLGNAAVREVVAAAHAGPSDDVRRRLIQGVARNREIVTELRDRYGGRCQLCGYDPSLVYGAGVCESHHIVYLSRGGVDDLENLLLVCPNHHTVIHATGAVFDFADLHYVFPNRRREPLVLNSHLGRAA